MEIRIVEERTNPLLKRHELRFEVAHATAATPTRDHVRTELADPPLRARVDHGRAHARGEQHGPARA